MIDWAPLADETIDLLRRYLAIDTSNHPGNEVRLAEDELRRVHGNHERIPLENLRAGVRSDTEMLLGMAAA